MTLLDRLQRWHELGVTSAEQNTFLVGLSRREPVSIFLELNILLYAGVLAFAGGLGWTVSTWSQQLGDVLVVSALSAIFVACFWYCFWRAPAWSRKQVSPQSLAFDYVLYLGSLVWSVDLGYLENRFHLLRDHWDLYLLASAGLFFLLAYRFDNRFVLSLALSSLAGWFGLTLSHWPSIQDDSYRLYAIFYSSIAGAGGAIFHRLGVKAHFLGTYLNVAANVLFWAVLSGVFDTSNSGLWFLALLAVCGASLVWGIARREFSVVAYAAVYGYVGASSLLIRGIHDDTAVLAYFVVTGVVMLAFLVGIARRFGRER